MPQTLPPLTLDALAAWAQSKPKQTILGRPARPESCPLARYLWDTTGKPFAVGTSTIQPVENPRDWNQEDTFLPPELQEVIQRVDGPKDTDPPPYITREVFLAILAEVSAWKAGMNAA